MNQRAADETTQYTLQASDQQEKEHAEQIKSRNIHSKRLTTFEAGVGVSKSLLDSAGNLFGQKNNSVLFGRDSEPDGLVLQSSPVQKEQEYEGHFFRDGDSIIA